MTSATDMCAYEGMQRLLLVAGALLILGYGAATSNPAPEYARERARLNYEAAREAKWAEARRAIDRDICLERAERIGDSERRTEARWACDRD